MAHLVFRQNRCCSASNSA